MRRSPLRIAFAIAALVALFVVRYVREERVPEPVAPPPRSGAPPAKAAAPKPTVTQSSAQASPSPVGKGSVADAFRKRKSDVWVEGSGTVEATLPDDREGSRHQKFIVRVEHDLTVLVSHNIDLAPRVPLDRGDQVAFRGEYVWNGKGGIIHWTHRDPRGGRGGWIRLGNEVYE